MGIGRISDCIKSEGEWKLSLAVFNVGSGTAGERDSREISRSKSAFPTLNSGTAGKSIQTSCITPSCDCVVTEWNSEKFSKSKAPRAGGSRNGTLNALEVMSYAPEAISNSPRGLGRGIVSKYGSSGPCSSTFSRYFILSHSLQRGIRSRL